VHRITRKKCPVQGKENLKTKQKRGRRIKGNDETLREMGRRKKEMRMQQKKGGVDGHKRGQEVPTLTDTRIHQQGPREGKITLPTIQGQDEMCKNSKKNPLTRRRA